MDQARNCARVLCNLAPSLLSSVRALHGVFASKEKESEEEESGGGKNVISPLFSLLNRLQPVRCVMWPNFTEPECLLAKCSKAGVR